MFFGLGWTEILIIALVIVLVFVGPKSLPALGRIIGSWFHEVKEIKNSLPTKDDFDVRPGEPAKKNVKSEKE